MPQNCLAIHPRVVIAIGRAADGGNDRALREITLLAVQCSSRYVGENEPLLPFEALCAPGGAAGGQIAPTVNEALKTRETNSDISVSFNYSII